ncbi:MAG: hypothetical protein HC904_10600 [Blastochloris sp.]|nr:hypothetical protein [Blastochloris sp.]
MPKFLALTLLVSAPWPLCAQILWDRGAGNNNWASANNWSPDGVPDGAGTEILLNSSLVAGAQTIDLQGTPAP